MIMIIIICDVIGLIHFFLKSNKVDAVALFVSFRCVYFKLNLYKRPIYL
jgi:hypothetical protein